MSHAYRNDRARAIIEWTLNVDGNPTYALRLQGPFAADTCKELRRFLRERLDEGTERVSIPGALTGRRWGHDPWLLRATSIRAFRRATIVSGPRLAASAPPG
jgi:hypothetical protein